MSSSSRLWVKLLGFSLLLFPLLSSAIILLIFAGLESWLWWLLLGLLVVGLVALIIFFIEKQRLLSQSGGQFL